MQKLKVILHLLRKILLDVRALYALGGFIMSIVAHEVFHILMHLDTITGVTFFPNNHAIITINATLSEGYNLDLEEGIAYGITAIIMFITIIDVFAIHDSRDRRTSRQTIFSSPKITKLHKRAHTHHPLRHFIHLFLITFAIMPVAAVLAYILR
ncbi:MAG TPA: hypothetical protein VGE13_03245 [Candidatus Saccharimonadales bacterium]